MVFNDCPAGPVLPSGGAFALIGLQIGDKVFQRRSSRGDPGENASDVVRGKRRKQLEASFAKLG
jgi:hypothetical protein